jgi:hypothetical protein
MRLTSHKIRSCICGDTLSGVRASFGLNDEVIPLDHATLSEGDKARGT